MSGETPEEFRQRRRLETQRERCEEREMALMEGFMFAHRVIHKAKGIPFPSGGVFKDGTWKVLCEVADGLTDVLLEDDPPEVKERLRPAERATAQSIHKAWGRIKDAASWRERGADPA